MLTIWSTWREEGWWATIHRVRSTAREAAWLTEKSSVRPPSPPGQHPFWSAQPLFTCWNSPVWCNRDYLEWNLPVFQRPQKIWRETCAHSQLNSISSFAPPSPPFPEAYTCKTGPNTSLIFAQKHLVSQQMAQMESLTRPKLNALLVWLIHPWIHSILISVLSSSLLF